MLHSLTTGQEPIKNFESPALALDIFKDFQCKFALCFETEGFIVKTAGSLSELQRVLMLRHQVFMANDDMYSYGYEFDDYDMLADHIIIQSKHTDEIVATYRLISSLYSSSFYAQKEFNIDDVLIHKKNYLEMGRACIKKEYRNGNLIDLLWRAIGAYINKTGTEALFGLCSIFTTDQIKGFEYDAYFKTFCNDGLLHIWPNQAYQLNQAFKQASYVLMNEREFKHNLPSLIKSYLLAGAQIYGEPAIDHEFSCIDVFTYVAVDKLHKGFKRRYLGF